VGVAAAPKPARYRITPLSKLKYRCIIFFGPSNLVVIALPDHNPDQGSTLKVLGFSQPRDGLQCHTINFPLRQREVSRTSV